MEVFILQCNIAKFTAMLATATDPMDICTLELLLMEEQQRLKEITASARLKTQAKMALYEIPVLSS